MVPLLAIHGAPQAILAGAVSGLFGGFATAACMDLLIRMPAPVFVSVYPMYRPSGVYFPW